MVKGKRSVKLLGDMAASRKMGARHQRRAEEARARKEQKEARPK